MDSEKIYRRNLIELGPNKSLKKTHYKSFSCIRDASFSFGAPARKGLWKNAFKCIHSINRQPFKTDIIRTECILQLAYEYYVGERWIPQSRFKENLTEIPVLKALMPFIKEDQACINYFAYESWTLFVKYPSLFYNFREVCAIILKDILWHQVILFLVFVGKFTKNFYSLNRIFLLKNMFKTYGSHGFNMKVGV